MAWTQDNLDRLELAIADGVTSVQYTDRKVEYRSLDEMLRVRDLIKRQLGQAPTASQRIYGRFSKGLITGGF